MKFLKKFESVDFSQESVISEGVLYLSPKFREKLRKMLRQFYNTPITIALLGKEGEEITKDWTYIDETEDLDNVSFINQKNAQKMILDAGYGTDLEVAGPSEAEWIWNKDLMNNDSGISRKSRNNIKVGRFIKGIFGDKFTDKQIETFVNQYKSIKEDSSYEFKLVSGDEISKWYLPENSKYPGRGTLGSSCMATESKNHFFKLYIQNPEVCSLLILLEGDKLIGRALVWKIYKIIPYNWDPKEGYKISKDINLTGVEYFMDRVYTSEDWLVNKFFEYSEKMNWCRRAYQSASNEQHVYYKGDKFFTTMSVKVKKLSYEPYPYLDTLKRYNHFDGTLNNDDAKRKGGHILSSTQGDYTKSISKTNYYINKFKDFIKR